MSAKEHDVHSSEKELTQKHNLVCNNELFMKDLWAIVDDTMKVEEDKY